jgi:hypothetical protein
LRHRTTMIRAFPVCLPQACAHRDCAIPQRLKQTNRIELRQIGLGLIKLFPVPSSCTYSTTIDTTSNHCPYSTALRVLRQTPLTSRCRADCLSNTSHCACPLSIHQQATKNHHTQCQALPPQSHRYTPLVASGRWITGLEKRRAYTTIMCCRNHRVSSLTMMLSASLKLGEAEVRQ